MKKQITATPVATVENCAAQMVVVAGHDAKAKTAGAELGRLMVALFIAHSGSDADFTATFGNGENGAKRVAGSLAEAVNAKLPKDKERAKAVLAVLKVRLSEARKLRRDGGMANPEDNNLQASLKRYAKQKAAAPKAPDGATSAAVVIAKDASLHDVAEAVSVWIGLHDSNAARALATALKDSLPITLTRNRKVS